MKLRLNLFLLALLILFFNNGFSQIQNINISGGNTFDGEPFLAVNPINPQNIVIAWMGVTIIGGVRISIKTKTSFDGGATWGNYHVEQHASTSFHSADVSMCFRNDGTLYMSYVDYRQNPDSGGVYLSSSNDGGITWQAPNEIWSLSEDTVKKPIDRPWLSCDNSLGGNHGMLYLTTKPPSWVPAPNRPYLKTSSDSGLTWSNYRFVDTTGYLVGNVIQAPMGTLATTADGALCIAYPSYLSTQSPFPKIYFAKSYNRGASFQYTQLLNNPVFAGDTNLKSGYSLVADPLDSNRLAFVYVGGQLGDADIFICSTVDGGTTWTNPVRVNDDSVSNGKYQDLVWASYNTAGELAITWRDRRHGSGIGFYQPCETYCSVSHDYGAHFTTNFSLSTVAAPYDSVLTFDGNDFMSCRLVDDTICAAWADVRNGKLNIYFAKASDSTGISTGIIHVATEEVHVMNVFPDPAFDKITVVLPESGSNSVLVILDEKGRKIFQKDHPGISEIINCSGFSGSIYYVIFTTDDYSENQKLIISR